MHEILVGLHTTAGTGIAWSPNAQCTDAESEIMCCALEISNTVPPETGPLVTLAKSVEFVRAGKFQIRAFEKSSPSLLTKTCTGPGWKSPTKLQITCESLCTACAAERKSLEALKNGTSAFVCPAVFIRQEKNSEVTKPDPCKFSIKTSYLKLYLTT